MSAKGWTMTVAAVAVAAGTYFALDLIFPPQQEKVRGPELAPVDAVFSRSLPPELAATAAPAAPRFEDGPAGEFAAADPGADPGTDSIDAGAAEFAAEPEPA
jgi:hypothetical protein